MQSNEHISAEMLGRYQAKTSAPGETLCVQTTHLATCEMCRQKLAQILNSETAFGAVRNQFAVEGFDNEPEHLPDQQLALFLDQKLDPVDCEIAESHLAICPECSKDLADLRLYREIAGRQQQQHSVAQNEAIAETGKKSFWQKLFAFDSVAGFATVAAVLLIAVLFGGWFWFRSNTAEIARVDNQNMFSPTTSVSNVDSNNNFPNNNASPKTSPASNTPQTTENLPNNEPLLTLADANGQITIDENGKVKGLENLAPSTQKAVVQTLQTGRVAISNVANSLSGNAGVLMGGGNADTGVPFALQTPVSKVVRENQPVLRWNPLKDSTRYSVAIVDDKFRVVEESGKLTQTNWKPSKPLPRGRNYSWQVTAIKDDGSEIVPPSSPAPQARFRIAEQTTIDEIGKLEKSGTRSHLALGVLYANAGLKQEAHREFQLLVKENPKSALARKLLKSVG